MTEHKVNIFEVLDNFFGSQDCPNAKGLNSGKIRALREHVIDFYSVYGYPPRDGTKTNMFLGGFLSSPPFLIEAAPYLLSALLISDSLVIFDPLHFWFCDEQYQRTRLLSAPPGWINLETKKPNYQLTKQYLEQAFAWLYQIRSLVEAGIIFLTPAERIVNTSLSKVKKLAKEISQQLNPIERFADVFPPEAITVDDNRKGLFTFTGGNRQEQIAKSIRRGIEQFAKDIIIANETGSIYTAPFIWEQILGKLSLDGFAEAEYQASLIEAIRNLKLPLLSNLSPDVLVKIHKDSSYTEFRVGLSETIQNINAEIGSQNFIYQVNQIERDILLPKVQAVQKEIQSSKFRLATNAIQEGFFTLAQSFIVNITTGMDIETNIQSSAAITGLTVMQEIFKSITKSGDYRIWAQLLPEKLSLSSYYRHPLTPKQDGTVSWEIDDLPSNNVKVSRGVYKFPVYS